MEKVQFQPNMPVRMALKYANGRTVEGRFGDQEYYTLNDGRCMYVNPDVAAKINVLELKPGEPFEICKYWSGKKGDSVLWDVRRVDPVSRDRISAAVAATAIEETELEGDLRRSLEQRNGKTGASVPAPAPAAASREQLSDCVQPNGSRSNGYTNGNCNGYTNGGANGGTPAPMPIQTPIDKAAIDAVRMVQAAMKETGEQWGDQAKQDFATTILILYKDMRWIRPPTERWLTYATPPERNAHA